MTKPARFLIVAEIKDDDIRCGFILGYVLGQDEAGARVDELFRRVKNSNLHWYDYFDGKYWKYPLAGDDHVGNVAHCTTSGLYSLNSVRADESFTIKKFIAERQIKTENFELADNIRLADHYRFDGEISNCN